VTFQASRKEAGLLRRHICRGLEQRRRRIGSREKEPSENGVEGGWARGRKGHQAAYLRRRRVVPCRAASEEDLFGEPGRENRREGWVRHVDERPWRQRRLHRELGIRSRQLGCGQVASAEAAPIPQASASVRFARALKPAYLRGRPIASVRNSWADTGSARATAYASASAASRRR